MQKFDGKSVVVTGGGKGLGLGISEAFLAAGASVFICGRSEPDTLPSAVGKVATFVRADIRDPQETQSLIDRVIASSGRLDVLINNAGGSPPLEAANASYRITDSIIRLNLIAPLILAQQAYHAMRETAKSGSIINIGSISAERPSPGTAAYGAAKAGLVNVTRSLAQEWGRDRIRVNAIIAGLIRTEAAEDHYGGIAGIELIESSLPLGRMAVPADIANACLFLAGEDSSYINGAALEVHGGGEYPGFLKTVEEAGRLS
jgi:NAD(P)-dependent dehydrogenase (short-subunit alcohol dehydrogenase family)